MAVGHRPDQQVGDEADDEDADHDVERQRVDVGAGLAGGGLGVGDRVDDQRPGHARRRPRGQQAAVDRPDLERPEEVLEVGRDGREAAAVEREDHAGQQHEPRDRRGAARGEQEVQDRPDAEVHHVDRACARSGPTSTTTRSGPLMLHSDRSPTKPAAAAARDRGEVVLDHRRGLLEDADAGGDVAEEHEPEQPELRRADRVRGGHVAARDERALASPGRDPSPRAASRRRAAGR